MASTAYTRPFKPPGPAGDRRPPRLPKELGRIKHNKLGIGVVASCCLGLLIYISFARLFAIYSPVLESTSLVMRNAPPGSTTVVLGAESVSAQQKSEVDEKDLVEDGMNTKDPIFLETTKISKTEEVVVTKPETKITYDETSVDEGFSNACTSVYELTGDIRISPAKKTMFFLNQSSGSPFDANGKKALPRHLAFLRRNVERDEASGGSSMKC